MGVVKVAGFANGYLKATSQVTPLAGTGDPGCATPSTYVIKLPSTSPANVALPFGSWVLSSGNATTQDTLVPPSALTIMTRGVLGGTATNPIVTLDPRTVSP
jgi:hypothetical protein